MSDEDVNHVFRGCADSVSIWESFSTGITRTDAFLIDWDEWMFNNLKCSKLVMRICPNYLIFSVTLWFIWKWRCEKVFGLNFVMPLCLGKIILTYVDSWQAANTKLDDSAPKENCLIS